MPDRAILRPDGLYRADWNSDQHRDIICKVNDATVAMRCLRAACDIDEDTTLGDIMCWVKDNDMICSFLRFYSWCPKIKEFHKCLDLKPIIDENSKVEYAEIHWFAQCHEYENENHIELGSAFHGIGTKDGEFCQFSIGTSPLETIAHLPLRLNKEVKMWGLGDNLNQTIPILEGQQCFSLLDVLDAIYFEISFHGGPDDNAEFLQKMVDMVEKIQKRRNGNLSNGKFRCGHS